MSNLSFETKKVKGKGIVYLTPCPHQVDPNVQKIVGNPKCCNKKCPRFVRYTKTSNGLGVHCKDVV